MLGKNITDVVSRAFNDEAVLIPYQLDSGISKVCLDRLNQKGVMFMVKELEQPKDLLSPFNDHMIIQELLCCKEVKLRILMHT
jgi:hypothetical protein